MTAVPWVLVVAESVTLVIVAVAWLRRAGRTVDAILAEPPSSPGPDEVAALTQVFVEVCHHSRYGGKLEELASAALVWMHQQQRGTP